MKKRSLLSGFTMFELLIVMAFMAIMGTIGIGYYFNYQRQTTLRSTAEEINAFLYATQQKSIGQEGASQWGVHFENPTGSGKPFYASFKGASYSTAAETRYLDGALDFSYPADGTSVDIVFNKITGKVSDGAYKKVYILLTPGVAMKAINVSPLGVITMNDGEVGWWKMDEGSGTTTGDSSGYGNTATINGGTWTASGKNSNGISLNGSASNYVRSDNNILLNSSQTYAAWVYPGSISGLKGVLTMHNHSTTSNLGINTNGNKFTISIGYTDGTREYQDKATNYSITPSTWSHVVLVYNSADNSVSFYVNGNFDSKWTLTKTVKFTSERVLIGQWANSYLGNYFFSGVIDDCRVYDHALTADEVKHLYETTK